MTNNILCISERLEHSCLGNITTPLFPAIVIGKLSGCHFLCLKDRAVFFQKKLPPKILDRLALLHSAKSMRCNWTLKRFQSFESDRFTAKHSHLTPCVSEECWELSKRFNYFKDAVHKGQQKQARNPYNLRTSLFDDNQPFVDAGRN